MIRTITVGDRRIEVDAVAVGAGWSLLIGGVSYDATLEGHTVYVGGHAIPVTIDDPRAYVRRDRAHHGAAAGGQQHVIAPMPGRVVKILVQPGDAVVARQGLLVVEAMKMENELRAPAAGTVREVRVSEGASVDAGAILVVLE